MGYDGWFAFGGVELVNHSRTAQLAQEMGIDTVRVSQAEIDWIQGGLEGYPFGVGGFGLGGFGGSTGNYANITEAPWYDAGYPASSEFAGLICLRVDGLDDSSLQSDSTEYTTDGGVSNKSRNATQPLVWNVGIIAKTDRGAEYGKKWMDRTLRGPVGRQFFAAGYDLVYFANATPDSPKAHRRDVKLSRGSSVTAKRNNACSALWLATFTMTANDPFEYGEPLAIFTGLGVDGGAGVVGPRVTATGQAVITQVSCPVYDYTPVYDPLYPALIPSPTAPDFYPAGWNIAVGQNFKRFWAQLEPVEPTTLLLVPVVVLSSTVEARMVRVSVWDSLSATNDQCGPLWSTVVTYLPPNVDFYVDGEQKASYVWDGASVFVRRTDSLVYSSEATPVEWPAFNDPNHLLVTLDIFDHSGYEGGGNVRADLYLVPKSD